MRGIKETWKRVHQKPLLDYLVIRICVFVLTALGIVMVMSSSMTWSIIEGSNVWGTARRQAILVFLGLVAFWLALKIRPRTIRKLSGWGLLIAIILLILVLIPGIGTGKAEVGSQSWIVLGPLRLQPSEFAKVALAIWGASHLADRNPRFSGDSDLRPWVTFCVGAFAVIALIFAEHDVGMALNVALMVGLLLFFAGIPTLAVAVFFGLGLLLVIIAGMGDGFRSHRISVYLDALFGHFEDTQGAAFQSYQGFLSLADGSAGGVGLGQSRAKWFYLPEAKNDFIFAVIGEELGLWGGALVICLFLILGIYGLRTALRAANQFQSLMAATITAGVVSQAFINIGYVIGLLPVTGIQLPMISAGGTSAIITLGSMGILANIARHEPEAVSAMQSYGRPTFDLLLFIPEPEAEAKEPAPPVAPSGSVKYRPHSYQRR